MEVVGRTVPRGRLGAFWAQRLFWGGIATVLAGLLVRRLLHGGTDAPRFALLFGLATVLVTTGYGLFSAVREPALPPTPETAGPLGMLREGTATAGARRPLPPPARRPRHAVGVVRLRPVHRAVRGAGAGRFRAHGRHLPARAHGGLRGLQPALAPRLAAAGRPRAHARRRGGLRRADAGRGPGRVGLTVAAGLAGGGPAVLALEAVFFLGGAAQSATVAGYSSLMLLLAPPGRRQAFIGLINTFLGPLMLLPMLGGGAGGLDRGPDAVRVVRRRPPWWACAPPGGCPPRAGRRCRPGRRRPGRRRGGPPGPRRVTRAARRLPPPARPPILRARPGSVSPTPTPDPS